MAILWLNPIKIKTLKLEFTKAVKLKLKLN